MRVLYIANKNYSSWSLRPWVVMRERGIPFEEKLVPFKPATLSSYDTFRAFSPSGKVPTLRDGELAIWDSLAIVEYLAEHHAGVWPESGPARAWARSAAAEMHSGFGTLRRACAMNIGVRVALRDPSAVAADVARIAEIWNEGLDRFGGPFLAGPSFTAVDGFFAPVAFRHQTYTLPLDGPAAAYAARLLALGSMKEWERAALAEPWRDEAHEAELRHAGTLVEDMRTP